MIQTLDLANTDNINFNGNEVEVLKLNNNIIWEKILADQLSRLIDRSITEVTAEDLEGVTTIGQSSFSGCLLLNYITIPSSVTLFADSAFSGCVALTTIKMLPTTPPTLSTSNIFPTTITRIEVPSASLSEYQSATYWSSFASVMVGV